MSPAGAPRYAVGIDLGGTNVKAVAALESGQVLQRAAAPTSDGAMPGRWVETIRTLVAELQAAQGYPASGVGVGAPGLASPDGRRIAYMRGRLAGLEGLDWSDALQVGTPVPVMNDAHAALWGEAWCGAAAGCHDAVLLTLGTGVGGATMTGGRLLRGENQRAGHWGHISVDLDGPPSIAAMPGSLEGALGNCSLAARSGGRFQDTRTLVDAHLRGDAEATRIWLRSVRALGVAIASIVNAVDPERVILGGGIAEAGEALFAPLREVLDSVEWRPHGARVQVVRAELGDQAGALGAARAALELSAGARATPGGRYLERARELVEIVASQHAEIARAADLFAAAILKGRVVHVFGSGHSRIMVEEMWPRYGSFPGFHPIVELSLTFHTQVVGANGQRQAMFLENVPGLAERILRNFQVTDDDAALVVSSSGGNVVSVEMAEGFQRRGLPVVALISRRHSEATPSRDARGCRVQDFADVVLDTGAPPGDAMVEVAGLAVPVAPGSTVGGCLIVNALKAEVAARLAAAGQPPPVLSGAATVGPEVSARMFEAAYDEHARRIGPLYSRPRDEF